MKLKREFVVVVLALALGAGVALPAQAATRATYGENAKYLVAALANLYPGSALFSGKTVILDGGLSCGYQNLGHLLPHSPDSGPYVKLWCVYPGKDKVTAPDETSGDGPRIMAVINALKLHMKLGANEAAMGGRVAWDTSWIECRTVDGLPQVLQKVEGDMKMAENPHKYGCAVEAADD